MFDFLQGIWFRLFLHLNWHKAAVSVHFCFALQANLKLITLLWWFKLFFFVLRRPQTLWSWKSTIPLCTLFLVRTLKQICSLTCWWMKDNRNWFIYFFKSLNQSLLFSEHCLLACKNESVLLIQRFVFQSNKRNIWQSWAGQVFVQKTAVSASII